MADQKELLEVLPHGIEEYQSFAKQISQDEFAQRFPYPFLLFVRNKLWDRSFLTVRASTGPSSGETRVAEYTLDHANGLSLLSPIKPKPGGLPDRIILGRAVDNDMVLPVSSVSSQHAAFVPPGEKNPDKWIIVDFGSRNGTHVNDEQVQEDEKRPLDHGMFVRFGGNVVAWFLYPKKLWEILQDDTKLREYTDP